MTLSNCVMGPGYTMTLKEFSSLAIRVGFADFISAKVWNDKALHGVFHRLDQPWDLAKWNTANSPWGFLRNICCSGSNCADSLSDTETRVDWLLAFLDMYTDTSCNPKPSQTDMLRSRQQVVFPNPALNDSTYYWSSASCGGQTDQQ